MSTFDWNANPESLASRAAELALEQNDRLRSFIAVKPKDKSPNDFYRNDFEIYICNQIARMMAAYAVLKGYVTPESQGIEPRP